MAIEVGRVALDLEPSDAQAEALFEELANGGVDWQDAWLVRNIPERRQRYIAVARMALRKALAANAPASCPQPCDHLSQQDAREGKTCVEHPCTCAESRDDARTIERLQDQIKEARTAWFSATEPGDDGLLVYTDKIEDAMDEIWSAIGTPTAVEQDVVTATGDTGWDSAPQADRDAYYSAVVNEVHRPTPCEPWPAEVHDA